MKRNRSLWLSLPLLIWTLVLVGGAIGYIIVLSFLKRDPNGGGAMLEFTLENYKKLAQPGYWRIIRQSLLLGAETTLICAALGYPFGCLMARAGKRLRPMLMLLVIVPFWTNALIRVYGWRILLMGTGPINTVLMALGLIDKPLKLMNTHGAVVLGMVYSLMPFMILPVYTSVEKMDWNMVDAGRDLGAHPARVFLTVTLPMTVSGLMTGCVLVFIPSLALFFMSDLLGGPNDILIGNVINDQLLKSQDWPFAAALSVILLVITALVMTLHRRAGGKSTDMTLF